jgi:hypothetical protein
VAVGHERPLPEFIGRRERLAVVSLGSLRVPGVALRGDLAEEPQRPRLVHALLVSAGEVDGLAREPAGIVIPIVDA